MDIHTSKIKNQLIVAGLILGLGSSIYERGISVIPMWMLQVIIPIILFYFLFYLGTFGAGDIKLFSMIAGFLTIREFLICVAVSFFAGGILALGKLLFFSKRKHLHTIHFSIPILAGYIYCLEVII